MVNILTIKDSVLNLINKCNTETSSYNVSDGLQTKVQYVTGANSEKQPVLSVQYPAIFVEIKKERDTIPHLGANNRRTVEVDVDVTCVVDYGITLENAREESDDELIRLTQNVQNMFRNYINLSTTVDSLEIVETVYDAKYTDNVYNSNSKISLLIKKRG